MADNFVKFKLDRRGVGNILKSGAVKSLTEKYAASYDGDRKSFVGYDRAKTIVFRKKR